MAGKPAIVMVIVVALIVFPQWTSNGEDAPSAKPFIEYEDELPGYGNFVSNDTDGDDQLEIFYYRQDGYMVAFDPPSYSRVLNLERTYPGFFPIFKDLGMNGSTEIIIFYKGAGHFNCSIISGKTFLELWRSPDIEGKASFPETGDVDCDGHMEVVWCAYEQVPGRIYVFDAVSNKMDWVSPKIMGLPTSYVDVTLKNIDEDPAQEIILEYKTSLLEVYDGATFELQWAIRSNEGSYFWTPNDFIRDFDQAVFSDH